ncbi:hypothetical protein BHE74_00048050 [Ensete ventricosum]|nr:hypothetical protein BHE74_00048050 [Ensete ventricosum]
MLRPMTEELDCSSAYIRLREPGKSKDKAERIYRSRKKGRRCKTTDSGAIGLAASWYRRDGTSYGRSKFDYSTLATESSWEPRGVLQPEQKIEDSANGKEMQRL